MKLGTVRARDGKCGPWTVDTFTISKESALMHNMGHARTPMLWLTPGTFKRLSHASRGVVMSNTPMEVRTNYEAFNRAVGRPRV